MFNYLLIVLLQLEIYTRHMFNNDVMFHCKFTTRFLCVIGNLKYLLHFNNSVNYMIYINISMYNPPVYQVDIRLLEVSISCAVKFT